MTQQRLLGGRYEVGDVLGYGGMAEVHHGRDVRLGREVAIKVLRADLARDPSFQTRFKREARAAASLNHPSIVSVYDTGEDPKDGQYEPGHTPYIVMEYVDGRTLRDVLKQEGRLHPQRAMEIAADICAALDFSHRAGIVHRDVKPGNVMITNAGAVKVMDFGIARAVADNAATVTSTAAVIGTAQYLSPEQARGEPVDARSDVYSLGCLLYELVTGHPPFTGDSPVAVAYQHVRENARPPSQSNPDVSPALDAIVMKALAKNPINRYQSAQEMRTDLVRAMTGRQVQAEPVMSEEERTTVLGGPVAAGATGLMRSTGVYRPAEPDEDDASKRTLAFVLVGIGVLVVAGLVGLLIWLNGRDKAPPQTQPTTVPAVGIPSLQGQDPAAANAKLQQLGFVLGTPKQQGVAANSPLIGKVVGTDPAAGTSAAKGSTVTLILGKGPDSVTVPKLDDGIAYDQAAQQLSALGLSPKRVDKPSLKAEDTVLGTNPEAGLALNKGDEIEVDVSTGKIPMPDVIGRTTLSAQQGLNKTGLNNVTTQEAPPPDDLAPGTVWRTIPAANESVAADTDIILYVVPQKPTDNPTSGTPTGTPTGTGTPSGIVIPSGPPFRRPVDPWQSF